MILRNSMMATYHFLTSRYGLVAAGVAGVMFAQLLLLGVKISAETHQKYLDAQKETIGCTMQF